MSLLSSPNRWAKMALRYHSASRPSTSAPRLAAAAAVAAGAPAVAAAPAGLAGPADLAVSTVPAASVAPTASASAAPAGPAAPTASAASGASAAPAAPAASVAPGASAAPAVPAAPLDPAAPSAKSAAPEAASAGAAGAAALRCGGSCGVSCGRAGDDDLQREGSSVRHDGWSGRREVPSNQFVLRHPRWHTPVHLGRNPCEFQQLPATHAEPLLNFLLCSMRHLPLSTLRTFLSHLASSYLRILLEERALQI
mmetsp:Transcript_29138/g.53661  ORF Transcript_29138/g.53661 Transcript_29138/m.53661 type:complete len:253 (-) Transcript_29138:561-1319(-)